MSRPREGRTIPRMSNFSQGLRSFKEGLDWRLIREYWKAVREHAWEILWGAGMVGIPFAIVTLYYAPSRSFLGWLCVWTVLVAGYYVWRADHIRLIPKFEIRGPIEVIQTPTIDTVSGHRTGFSTYFQLQPRCLTEGEVESCRGYLRKVERWSEGGWEPTELNEVIPLQWSLGSQEGSPITLHPGLETRLNVFFVHSERKRITPCIHPMPLRALDVFFVANGGRVNAFRFDIKVTAKDCSDADFYVTVHVTNDPHRPTVEVEAKP